MSLRTLQVSDQISIFNRIALFICLCFNKLTDFFCENQGKSFKKSLVISLHNGQERSTKLQKQ